GTLGLVVERRRQPGDFRLGQEALELAHRRLFDAARRVVGAQAALDRKGEDRADQRDALRGDAFATRGQAAGRPLFAVLDLLGRPAGGDGIAHPLDIGAGDAVHAQLAEQRTKVMLDAAAVRFEGRRLFVADAL